MGAKKAPFYRIVATDARRSRDGQYLELIGTYAPTNDGKVTINEELAFDGFFSEFVEYQTSNEILKFLFSLPVGQWFNTRIFVEKFE